MTTALFMAVPARSRLEVIRPLAQGLARKGAEVFVVAPPDLRSVVEAWGLRWVDAGVDMQRLRAKARRSISHFETLPPDRQAFILFSTVWPRCVFDRLLKYVSRLSVDFVVHEEGDFVAPLIASALRTRRVEIAWPCPPRPRSLEQRIRGRLIALGHTLLGKSQVRLKADVVIFTAPPSFQKLADRSLDGGWQMNLLSLPEPAEALPWLEELPHARTLHMTLGTVDVYNRTKGMYEMLLEAVRYVDLNVVLSVGDTSLDDDRMERTSHVRIERYVPHNALLPHCDLVICHGGAGTTIEALARGCPMLIVPGGGASQKRNGVACAALGAGRMMSQEEFQCDRVKECIGDLLGGDDYRNRAEGIAQEIAQLPTVEQTVERLLRTFS